MSKTYFNLSEGGAQILQSASRIYAAYVTSGRVPEGKEKEWMRRSLKHAMSFAKTIDDLDDSPRHPAAVATGAAIAASVAAGSLDVSDPDDTAGHDQPTDPAETSAAPSSGDPDDGGSPEDTGIELTATTDEQSLSDDDVLASIMGDESQPQESAAVADPTGEMMDELPDSDRDMSLDADDDFPIAPKPTAADSDTPVKKDSSVAENDELDIDDNVLAAFADTDLDADDEPAKPAAEQATAPPATDESNDADTSGEAIEFLSTLADDLPPATDEPADMNDIMSALMDDAAEPTGPTKQADAANPSSAANANQDPIADSTEPEPPIAIDDAEDSIPIADDDDDADKGMKANAVESADHDEKPASKAPTESDQPQFADLDEPTNPTEANLAATHLPDDLSFELVDEDIDMNKLIEDAITATEKKDKSSR